MRKVFDFDSPADPYIADAAVLCCFDHRINLAVRKFLKDQSIERPDMIVVAGGAKTLASPRNDLSRISSLNKSACRSACTKPSACL